MELSEEDRTKKDERRLDEAISRILKSYLVEVIYRRHVWLARKRIYVYVCSYVAI